MYVVMFNKNLSISRRQVKFQRNQKFVGATWNNGRFMELY